MRYSTLILSLCLAASACDDGDDLAVDAGQAGDAGAIDGALPDSATADAAQRDAARPDAAQPDAAQPDSALPDAGADAALPDAAQPDAEPGAQCPGGDLEFGRQMPDGDCVLTRQLDGVVAGVQAAVRADCTDPAITALADKRHLIMVPDVITQDALWLHFGGSGGQPTNTENIGLAAASVGYRYISLSYPNEPSIASRCRCPEGPRPESCEERVRVEIATGRDVTPWFNMEADEAIVPRLVALLRYMDAARPDDGWGTYLTADGEPEWSRFALSGFSQGGGMAGLFARDHLVARTLYFSKGAGSSADVPANPQACASQAECEGTQCCDPAAGECDEPGEGYVCMTLGPVEWASHGQDVDGDGLGDGDASTRATPPGRQFAVVHREEGAWGYSPEVFAGWGMGAREAFVDADAGSPPYGGTQLLSTGLPPRNDCSEHQSMGADSCQPRRPDGLPAMWDAWVYAMSTPVD